MSLDQLEMVIRENSDADNFDMESVKNLHDTIQESLDNTFSSLASKIKSAISGSVDI
jgi:hypothetical protein